MTQYWKISDFAKELGKHANTVDGWFKQLEDKSIHGVNRTEHGEKVYDILDLDIALFIKEKRDKKWALDAIFNELPEHFELRSVWSGMENTSVTQTTDIDSLKKEFLEIARGVSTEQIAEIKKVYEQAAAAQISEIKKQYDDLLKRLPEPKNREIERQERIDEMITRRRIEVQLEKEALHIWSTKPEEERVRRVGIFRKEEDRDKRDLFVKEFVNVRFEERLKQEYDV